MLFNWEIFSQSGEIAKFFYETYFEPCLPQQKIPKQNKEILTAPHVGQVQNRKLEGIRK